MSYTNNPNEEKIYNYLTGTAGLSTAAAVGIMTNLFYEGGFRPDNAEDSKGYNDTSYTNGVNNGSYSNFAKDKVGYGLAQWTWHTRKQALLNYAKSKGSSIGDLDMQLEFLMTELSSGSYPKTWNAIVNCSNDANGAYEVARIMCLEFENPANASSRSIQRAQAATRDFYPQYSGNSVDGSVTGDTAYNGYVSDSPTYNYVSSNITLSATDSYSRNLESAIEALTASGDIYSSIINLRSGEEFKFYTNSTVSENLPVSYSSPGNILGRSVPVLGYDNTGARTVAINLELFAGAPYRPDLDPKTDSDLVETLHKDLDLLKSFEYPDYSSAIVIPPPMVLLSIGSSLKIRGALQGLQIEYSRPFDSKNRPMMASVSFTVTQVSEDPPDNYDIRNRTTKSF